MPIIAFVAAALVNIAVPSADDGIVLKFQADKVFELVPGSMLMNVEHMTEVRPAWITKEPAYKNKPWYATLHFGEPAAAKHPVIFALDEDDDKATLYIDLNANGDLTDDAAPTHERTVTPEERRTPQLKVWIYDLFKATVTANYADGSKQKLPITVRTYGKVCRDLSNNMKPDIVYWNEYYRAGTAKFGEVGQGGAGYSILVKDQTTNGRFDTIKGPNQIWGDTFYIDLNRNGKFESRTEGSALDNPFLVDGAAYEISKISPAGDRIWFAKSTREVIATSLKIGQLAPDFDIPSIGKLSSLRGKVVLIDFWATWCIPCLAEMPTVIKVHDRFKDQGFQVIGVSIDKKADADKLHEVARDKGMAWPEVHDAAQPIAKSYFVNVIPATFLIGPDGKILATHLRGEALDEAVERAVAAIRPK